MRMCIFCCTFVGKIANHKLLTKTILIMKKILAVILVLFITTPIFAVDFQTTLQAAKEGNAEAQFTLGEMYYAGKGVTQDYTEAYKWYRKAAEQGHKHAQISLGVLYYEGEGVTQDYAETVKWLLLAAEQGHAYAQACLALMYHNGNGVAQDHAEAAKWYRQAAEQGNAEAQFNLGYLYYVGKGVTQDYAEAVKWFHKAAEQDRAYAQDDLGFMYNTNNTFLLVIGKVDVAAQSMLGQMYQYGEGVTKDLTQAAHWYRIAAEQGDGFAQEMLKELEY